MTAILIDLSIVAILVLAALIGYFRGFIKSFLGAASLLLALFIAYAFTSVLAPVVSEHFLKEPVGEKIAAMLDDGKEDDMRWDGLALFFELGDQKTSDFKSYLNGNKGEELQKQTVEKLTERVCGVLSSVIAFVLLFIAAYLLLLLLRLLLGLAAKLPGVKQADRIFGLLFGILYGYGLLCLLTIVLSRFWPVLSLVKPALFPADALDRTLLFRLVQKYNLWDLLLRLYLFSKF